MWPRSGPGPLRSDGTRSAPGTAGWGRRAQCQMYLLCSGERPPEPVKAAPGPPRAAPEGTWKTYAGLAARFASLRCFPSIHLGCLQTDFKPEPWHTIRAVPESFQTAIR